MLNSGHRIGESLESATGVASYKNPTPKETVMNRQLPIAHVAGRTALFASMAAVLTAVLLALGCSKPSGLSKEKLAELEAAAKRAEEAEQSEELEAKPKTGREVLDRMVAVYRKASRYADAGTVRLLAEAGEEKIDKKANFSVSLERPNKVRLQAYQAMLVCDGKKLQAAIKDVPGQVLVKQAPGQLSLKTIYSDRILATALSGDFAGALPQVMLLLADDPLKAMLRDAEEPSLAEPGQIDGRDCYRVRIKRPDGMAVFWIDQQTYLLRRIVFPTDELRQALSPDKPVETLSMVAEFPGAKIDGKIDAKAFEFQMPEGAETVKFFIPPHTAQLLSKRAPDFKFFTLDGKPVTPESIAGKIAVLDFWATWCGPCKESLPNLEKVYQKYKDNGKVAFYAVSVDQPQIDDKTLAKTFEDLKVNVPILRDKEQSAAAFKFTGIPTSFIIGSDGIVQDYEVGGNPKLAETLPEKIEKLLAGENIFEAPLKEYQEQLKQYAKMLESSPEGEPAAGEPIVEERKLPEVNTAKRSEPSTLKLAPLWKCPDLKAPGNILLVEGKNQPPRLLVIDAWRSLAEVGLDGKLIATHKLDVDEKEMEVVSNLRSATGADGKRYVVVFASAQQRLHLLDENFKRVLSYPEDALKKPHSGIADVELGDLAGDGTLQICVGYWGVVGVQGVSLDGKRLWSNRSLSNVIHMAIGGADEKGRRNVFCTNNSGSLVALDADGERRSEISIPKYMFHWVVSADLRGDGQPLWCGLAAPRLGDNLAVGLSLKGEELWNYLLPAGVQPQPIEPVIAGKLTREGPGQWILPGPDGSIHILTAEGKLLDKFNYGATLQGLATVEVDGRPVLVVSSPNGLEAWKVE
jgi:thiol-disulfide isomerase/thioredoxin